MLKVDLPYCWKSVLSLSKKNKKKKKKEMSSFMFNRMLSFSQLYLYFSQHVCCRGKLRVSGRASWEDFCSWCPHAVCRKPRENGCSTGSFRSFFVIFFGGSYCVNIYLRKQEEHIELMMYPWILEICFSYTILFLFKSYVGWWYCPSSKASVLQISSRGRDCLNF